MGKNKQLQIELQEGLEPNFEEEGFCEVVNNDELSDAQIRQRYFKWLCDPLFSAKEDQKFTILLTRLHSIEFTWTVPNDGNRVADGEKLREIFVNKNELGFYEWSLLSQRPCSVLEVMVAISESITEFDEFKSAAEWFWILIENLGLQEFTDDNYYAAGGMIFVKDIVNNMIRRNYTYEGNGGLFPLNHINKDQRKVELWYQMQQYLRESWGIGGDWI